MNFFYIFPVYVILMVGGPAEAAPAAAGGYGLPEIKFGSKYDVTETIRMHDHGEGTVGYSVQGDLSVEYLHKNLIQATINPLKLHITSRKAPIPEGFVPHSSKLDDMENGPFLVEVEEGHVKRVLISSTELPAMVNFKKGVAGLFQFQTTSGDTTETDMSGECKTKYHVETNRIIKEKYDCTSPNLRIGQAGELWGNGIESSRRTVIGLKNQQIVQTVDSFDKHTTRLSISSFAYLGVTAELKLKIKAPDIKTTHLTTRDIDSIIRDSEKQIGVSFKQVPLEPEKPTVDTNIMKFSDAVDKFNKHLQDSELGNSKSAWALVKLVRSAKNSNAEDLYSVLASKKNKAIRYQLIDLYGSVQTNATYQAALKFLKINTKNMDLDSCERYLWALSMSPNIKGHIVKEIFDLVKHAVHPNEKLWQTLILTLPAMAYRYNEKCGYCDQELIRNTVSYLNESMNDCKENKDECQLTYLRGLVNIPTNDMKTTLIEKVLTSKGRVGVTAMRYIEKLGPKQWDDQILRAAERIYLSNSTYDSSTKCIALDVLLKSNPNDTMLYKMISILKQPYSSRELKEYLFQRLNDISETDPHFRKRANLILVQSGFNHYNYLAQGGLSTAFRRDFMDGGALSTTQEVVGKVLKRGNVHVNLMRGQMMEPVFTLGLFSTGLSSFMASSEEATEDEDASGGLELNVLGVGLRPFVFFNGHTELMGHIWSGTASSLTPALQALILLEDNVVKIPLGVGYYASITTAVGASIDLSGKIEISLWHRNAESLVQNRAGLAFDARIDIDSSYVKTTAEYNLFAEPEVHLTSHIKFAGETALCLQLQQPSSTIRFNTYRIERIPGSKHKLRKSRYRTLLAPGKTYALNSKNNEMCNAILSE